MVEHYLDTVGVTGSNPVSRTISSPSATTCAFSSKSNASIVTLFCLDGLIQGKQVMSFSQMTTAVLRASGLRPVTSRSEQPIQSHISRSPAKHRRRRFLLLRLRIPVTDSSCAGGTCIRSIPISILRRAQEGSSLTISGARQRWRWL